MSQLRVGTVADTSGTAKLNIANISQSGYYVKQVFTEADTADRTVGTGWSLMWTGTNQSNFKAGSKVRLQYHMALRNDSGSWGGGYIEPQISFDNSAWYSLGGSGYDGGVMISTSAAIGSYNNSIIVDPASAGITGDFSVRIRFYAKSYDGTLYWNLNHDLGARSGTATLIPGVSGLQHYCSYTIEELAKVS